jgi:transposase
VAIEACREAWHVHARLSEWDNDVLLVDTTRVKQLGIGQHGRKTDRIDAEVLATSVEQGRLPLAHLLSPARQQLRLQLSVRRSLVDARAELVVTVRGLVRAQGGKIPACSVTHFVRHAKAAMLDTPTRALIAPLLGVLEQINVELASVEQHVEELCRREPVIERLMTAPSVGVVVAACFVSVVDDAHRFRNSHAVGAYIGLVPSEKSSGDRRRLGSITKHGNGYLRSMLVEASWNILRRNIPDPLHQWARSIAKRRGTRIAVVAVARRLACILWAIWRDDTVYEPEQVGKRRGRRLSEREQDPQVRVDALERARQKLLRRKRNYKHHLALNKEVTTA